MYAFDKLEPIMLLVLPIGVLFLTQNLYLNLFPTITYYAYIIL